MSFHHFVVKGWLHSVRGPPSLDRGLAFFYAIPEQAQGWDEAYTREFPEDKAMPLNEIKQRGIPKTEGVTLYKCRLRGQEIQSNHSTSIPPQTLPSDLLRLRHELLASKRVLKTLNRVQLGWSIERYQGLENIILPQFKYDTENHKLLVSVVAHLLKEFGPLIGKGRCSTPPGQCTLSLAMFCDGITPRGRPNVNMKAALVDLGGTLFPFVENIPETTGFFTWRGMSKVDYSGGVAEHRPRELNTLAAHSFVVPMRFSGRVHRVQVTVAFQFVIADHVQVWWELGGCACVVCPWARAHGVRDMFLHEPLPIHERPCTRFAGTTGLQNVFSMQPALHNIKGAISRACSVVGRTLPPADASLLFQYLVTVAKRYSVTKLPVDSRQHCSLVRRRFRTGVLLTGREARSLASRLAHHVALPLPYHVLFLSICYIIVLIYSGTLQIPTSEWCIWGLLHVFLMHLILEYSKEGSTQTLYCHGMEHVLQLPGLTMGCSDEAGERDLRVGNWFAHLTFTVADKVIQETLGLKMYVKLQGRRARRSEVHFWQPERRGMVLEQCVVSASPMWRAVLGRFLANVLENNTLRCYMHMSTQSVYITTDTCNPQMDLCCICGRCGAQRSGQWR